MEGPVIVADQLADLSIDQGVPFAFSVKTGEDPTGWTASLQVRDRAGGLIFADLAVGSGLALDVPNRTIDAVFSVDQIAAMTMRCVWDLVITPAPVDDVAQPAQRLAQGSIWISPGVSR